MKSNLINSLSNTTFKVYSHLLPGGAYQCTKIFTQLGSGWQGLPQKVGEKGGFVQEGKRENNLRRFLRLPATFS